MPLYAFFVIVALCLQQHDAVAADFDTFLEPNRQVELGSPHRDRLERLHVEEGDSVEAGQLLAEFDTKVLKARLEQAKAAAAATGGLESARALVVMRQNRLAMLEGLRQGGSVRPQELETTKTNLAMAKAQLQAEKENHRLRALEKEVILAQLEEKRLYSPFTGVVATIQKREGELAGGVAGEWILSLLQLNPLLAGFNLPPALAKTLEKDSIQSLSVNGQEVAARVAFISPVINAESGTVIVRLEVANPDAAIVSGSRAILSLPLPEE